MKISNLVKYNINNNIWQKPKNIDNKKHPYSFCCKLSALNLLSNYKKININFGSNSEFNKKDINKDKLMEFGIPNMHIIGNGIRGESLSSKKNRKFLIPVKNCGIETIIDLRDKFTSQSYEDMCKKAGLKYYHIPIDSNSIEDKEIINSLPKLFSLLEQEHFYIACAQGLHRTDIALALNYVFNPEELTEPPIMYGHFRDYGFKFNDIATRLNSIEREITKNDIEKIGWDSEEEFRQAFVKRKKNLKTYNENIADNFR